MHLRASQGRGWGRRRGKRPAWLAVVGKAAVLRGGQAWAGRRTNGRGSSRQQSGGVRSAPAAAFWTGWEGCRPSAGTGFVPSLSIRAGFQGSGAWEISLGVVWSADWPVLPSPQEGDLPRRGGGGGGISMGTGCPRSAVGESWGERGVWHASEGGRPIHKGRKRSGFMGTGSNLTLVPGAGFSGLNARKVLAGRRVRGPGKKSSGSLGGKAARRWW